MLLKALILSTIPGPYQDLKVCLKLVDNGYCNDSWTVSVISLIRVSSEILLCQFLILFCQKL